MSINLSLIIERDRPVVTMYMTNCASALGIETQDGIENKPKPYNILWDTGSPHTILSKTIIDDLNPLPFGKMLPFLNKNICGWGSKAVELIPYFIGFIFSGHVIITLVFYSDERPYFDSTFDAIIGMDFINKGNFALLNNECDNYTLVYELLNYNLIKGNLLLAL